MSQDARQQWALIGPKYGFNATSTTTNGTFADNYNGEGPLCTGDLQADFNSAMAAMAQTMGTDVPGYGIDDIMEESLSNWPDPV